MTRTELLALADACELGEIWATQLAAINLRQIAEAQPVAWRFEVRGIKPATAWKLYSVTHSKVAVMASVKAAQSDDIEGRAVPLYPLPLED